MPPHLALMVCLVAAAPTRTSPIVLARDEGTVCAVDQDGGTVIIWPWASGEPVREVAVGEEPRTLAIPPSGDRLYATCQRSQTLAAVDLREGRRVAEIPIGGQPYGVLLSSDGRRAFVSQYAGGYLDGRYRPGLVAVVDLDAGEVVARLPTRAGPWAMALSADGRSLLVTHYLSQDGTGFVTEVDVDRLGVAREFALEEDDAVDEGRGGIFNALSAVAIHPSLPRAVVSGMHANVRRGAALSGRLLSHKTTVQAALRTLDLETGREVRRARMCSSFDGQAVSVPSAVAFLGSGEHLVETYFASSDFKVIRYNERGVTAERALVALPPGPAGVAVTKDGRTAFFLSRWGGVISRASLADPRDPRRLGEARAEGGRRDAAWARGAVLFHETRETRMTANRWVSCGACHLDGGIISDGLVWDLTVPGGPPKVSNTMDLATMSRSSPPFFHRGEEDVATALERFVRVFQRGGGFVGDGRSAFEEPAERAAAWGGADGPSAASSEAWGSILAYVRSLWPRPNPHLEGMLPRPEIRAAAERGRRTFIDPDVGCVGCHPGPSGTMSGTGEPAVFDVGTGGPLDTPALLGLWETAPYLHDGRARTLSDVLTTHNRDDRHGRTSHLRESEVADLVAFLLAPCEE